MHGGHLLTLFYHGIVAHDHLTFQAAHVLINIVSHKQLSCKTRVHTGISTARTISSNLLMRLSISVPRLQTSSVSVPLVFGDMLGASMRRGRAPADNSDVLAMFRLQYSGEGASQPLVDDAS